ncbi:MAG: glycoside hydrolase family 43 protein [Lachnospiraceae bacterium]|nr:glycoside hydrolase family 43 protein [Lachnospiraceae bacterium]
MSKEREPLVTHIYTADPSAHVYDGKLYIYPSHDIPHNGEDNDNGDEYQMEDYHVLTMDSIDAECVDHGVALHKKDVPWVTSQMWAPDAVYKNGKYYLVFPARDQEGNFRLGIASSDKPEGPFTAEESYIEGSYSIDPAAFVDDDGKVYVYFGGLWGGQLEKYQSGQFDPDAAEPAPQEPALSPRCAVMSDDMLSFEKAPVGIEILDENGKPLLAGDEDRRYFEGPWMHKYQGKYYLSYSTGTTHYIVYATGDHPLGPFTYRGRVMEPVIGWTTHHSIVEFKGKWYLFYHDCEYSGGINHRRSVKFTELHYNEDGTIQTIFPYGNKED